MVRPLTDGRKAALIINECQIGVIEPGKSGFAGLAKQAQERGIVAKIAALAEVFRKAGLPVIHTPVAHRTDFADVMPNTLINALTLKHRTMAIGTPETEYVEALRPRQEDFVIERTAGLIAFNATALDALLRRMNVETVVLTGVSTNVAMPGNTMTASDLGYAVVIPEDCIAGSDPETHRTIVENQLRMVALITTAEDVTKAVEKR